MNKILLILSREYITRVRKTSFIVMSILGPLLMAALIIIPIYITLKSEQQFKVAVVDDNEFFINKFKNTEHIEFQYITKPYDDAVKDLSQNNYNVVLHILKTPTMNKANMYSSEKTGLELKPQLEQQMSQIIFDCTLRYSFNVSPSRLKMVEDITKASIGEFEVDKMGNIQKTNSEISMIIGMLCGFLIYMFVFMFSSIVLRSVLEEKTGRIMEVLVSSVKPIQLMLGKILGVALVGFTQCLLWIFFTVVFVYTAQLALPKVVSSENIQKVQMLSQNMMDDTNDANTVSVDNQLNVFKTVGQYYSFSFTALILIFLFYFIFGYLLYASLFAAIGSAVDNETDTNQFILPLTIPLILSIALISPISMNPSGSLAWWFSMIPFTSPVAMMIRIPSGVPVGDLILSMFLLLLFIAFSIWIAAKIYRTGVLMYGKKVSYKEIFKWLRY